MSKKIKAVIITRTNAYFDYPGTPDISRIKDGREDFGKAILDEEKKHFSEGKYSLKKCLKAKQIIKDWGNDFFSKANNDYGISIPDDIKYDPSKRQEYVYKKLISKDLLSEIEKASKCYVSFKHKDEKEAEKETEVILILWDRLGRDAGEKVDDINLFINSIIDDFKIDKCDEDTENALYIHDKQIIDGVIDFKDATIWDKSNLKIDVFNEIYNSFKDYFVFVATFGHASGSVIFNERILKFKFGEPTPADKISEKENKVASFSELRREADKILEETRKRNSQQ